MRGWGCFYAPLEHRMSRGSCKTARSPEGEGEYEGLGLLLSLPPFLPLPSLECRRRPRAAMAPPPTAPFVAPVLVCACTQTRPFKPPYNISLRCSLALCSGRCECAQGQLLDSCEVHFSGSA